VSVKPYAGKKGELLLNEINESSDGDHRPCTCINATRFNTVDTTIRSFIVYLTMLHQYVSNVEVIR
jgi:hypothetical protein